jgi:hypothetical protein
MKDFWKYYICNKYFWIIVATIIGMLFSIGITLFGIYIIITGVATILQEIKILNEEIHIGICAAIIGYAIFLIGSYIVKIIRKVSEKYL